MSRFRSAPDIAALRADYERDFDRVATEPDGDDRIEGFYGRDKPRFLGGGGGASRTMRPNARHLLNPMWRDEHGREYTPDHGGGTTVWWVRIPPGLTRRQRSEGTLNMTTFPMPADDLTWHRISEPERTVSVRIAVLDTPKAASAMVITAEPVDSDQTADERERAERRRERAEQRAATARRDEH